MAVSGVLNSWDRLETNCAATVGRCPRRRSPERGKVTQHKYRSGPAAGSPVAPESAAARDSMRWPPKLSCPTQAFWTNQSAIRRAVTTPDQARRAGETEAVCPRPRGAARAARPLPLATAPFCVSASICPFRGLHLTSRSQSCNAAPQRGQGPLSHLGACPRHWNRASPQAMLRPPASPGSGRSRFVPTMTTLRPSKNRCDPLHLQSLP